ncbi:MAG: OmpH family outer membrane protein [Bacteroidales bacterium]|jgi:outer membrane protein|nr:OmpH family outer membrane protein [Bacteroidales bacterium]
MKVVLKIVFIVAVAIVFHNSAYAQKPLKLAHIDSQELMRSMPEYDTAVVKLQKLQKELEGELENLRVEYNRKLEEYVNNQKNWTDLVRQSREQELQGMQQKTQVFQESAMETMEQEQAKLMQPVREKANKAIETIAVEQGITYVLEAQSLYFKSADSQNILPLVQQHLGIKKQ